MTLPDVNITSEMLWISALVTGLVDVPLVLFLARHIPPARFRRLHWPVAAAAAVFWAGYGLLLFAVSWDFFYAKFLPDPGNRSLARLLLEQSPYGLVGLALWWLAERLPGNPVVSFCLLGGAQALPEHLWGVYGLGMLEKVPSLQGVSLASLLVFAVFEYILYWGSILSLAMLLRRDEGGSHGFRAQRRAEHVPGGDARPGGEGDPPPRA